MYGKPGWPNTVCRAEFTDSSGTRSGNSDSSKWRLLVVETSKIRHEAAPYAICYLHRLFQTYPVHEPTNLRHV